MMRRAKKPNKLDAQRGLSFPYIWLAKRGKAAPAMERKTAATASAEAETERYASVHE